MLQPNNNIFICSAAPLWVKLALHIGFCKSQGPDLLSRMAVA